MNKLYTYILNSAKKNRKVSDSLQKFEEKKKHTHKLPAALMLEHAEQGVVYDSIKGNTAVGNMGLTVSTSKRKLPIKKEKRKLLITGMKTEANARRLQLLQHKDCDM